jgi:hypothetical protein
MRSTEPGSRDCGFTHFIRAPERRANISRVIFFIIFVDRKFTFFIERPFTSAFDASTPKDARACLCRAGNAD